MALTEEDEDTPLQQKLEKTATLMGYIGLAVAVVMFIVYLIEWSVDVAKNHRCQLSGQHPLELFYH